MIFKFNINLIEKGEFCFKSLTVNYLKLSLKIIILIRFNFFLFSRFALYLKLSNRIVYKFKKFLGSLFKIIKSISYIKLEYIINCFQNKIEFLI